MASQSSVALSILADAPQSQLVASPFSISSAMCMIGMGAQSSTLQEISSVFKCNHQAFESVVKDMTSYNVTLLNVLCPADDLTINAEYMKAAEKYYGGLILPQNFSNATETTENVNSLFSKKTNGRIENMLEPDMIKEDMKAIMVNTLNAPFEWYYKFNSTYTSPQPFRLASNEIVNVEMMHRREPASFLIRFYGGQAYGIVLPNGPDPYNSPLSMEIILPFSNSPNAIFSIERRIFQRPSYESLMYVTQMKIPKFDVTNFFELKAALQKLGIKSAFESNANFSRMSSDKFHLSQLFQKLRVSVNEMGVNVDPGEGEVRWHTIFDPSSSIQFFVDRPFFANLRYKGSIIASVRILDPRK